MTDAASLVENARRTIIVRLLPIGQSALAPAPVRHSLVCRQIVGTILAYQGAHPETACSDSHPADAWDPGEISDAALQTCGRPAVWTAIQNLWAAGIVAEVHRGPKPMARLHSLGLTLGSLVPHDAGYVQCDCRDAHVPLAVRAFPPARSPPPHRTRPQTGIETQLRPAK